MSPRSCSTAARGQFLVILAIATGCTTGGPILTGTSPLGTATPTPAATATPVATPTPTATATPTPVATPSVTPQTTPSPGTGQGVTIAEGTLSLQGGVIAIFSPFPLTDAGSLDFLADWTSSANDIDIALASGTCTVDLFNAGGCSFAGLEESATMKPEELVLPLPAGTYTPLIGNFSAPTESITYRVVFTPNPSASARDVAAFVAGARNLPAPILVRGHGKLGLSR